MPCLQLYSLDKNDTVKDQSKLVRQTHILFHVHYNVQRQTNELKNTMHLIRYNSNKQNVKRIPRNKWINPLCKQINGAKNEPYSITRVC